MGYSMDERCESPLLISALMPHGNVLEYIEHFKPCLKQRVAFVSLGMLGTENVTLTSSHSGGGHNCWIDMPS